LLLALGAETNGAVTSIPMTLVGGLVLGVLQQVTLELTSRSDAGKVVLLVTILVMVMVRGKAIGQAFSVSGSGIAVAAPVVPPPSLRAHWSVTRRTAVLSGSALAVAVLLPHLPVLSADSKHFQLALITCYALVSVSLCLLVGWSGQVSLGHFAIVGLGAFVTARLADSGVGLVVIVLLAGLAGAVLMVIVGLPALRVPGLTLAVTSLGLAVIAPIWLLRQPWISDEPFGMPIDGLPAPLRGLPAIGSVEGVYYLGLVLLAATLLLLAAVRGSAFGRAVLAVRDNETAAAAFGLTPAAVKTAALAVSGFIAGLAGVVWAGAWETAAPRAFSADLSLLLLAVPVIGGVTSLAGSVTATTVFFSLSFFVSPYVADVFGGFGKQIGFQLMLAGLGVVGTLLAYPGGMASVGNRLLVRWWRSLDRVATQREAEASEHRETPLVVQDVQVAFGGVQALRGASIEVRKGEIVGLIGPNGAGKSTLMNVVSGVVSADRASVRVFGTELIGLGREFRPAHGVGRSFQDASLFAGLTVREVIQVAADRRHRSGALSQAFRMPWARAAEAASRADADEVIEKLGLGAWADSPVSELSTGTRRICDLAAQSAARPAVLLLDEPTAGVAQRDAEAFGPLLRRLRDELDCAILVIEHDMGLLMGLCDRLYAMDAGVVIAEGTPEQVRSNPQVVASYLGTSDTAIDRSGPVVEKAPTPRKRTPRARLIVSEET
jgi:ABC-type branched-subunit amino acid transport system ATPase component/ABC-type branched-subunit amino acid transport system permease subunit